MGYSIPGCMRMRRSSVAASRMSSRSHRVSGGRERRLSRRDFVEDLADGFEDLGGSGGGEKR
jgi:hypothetical protein